MDPSDDRLAMVGRRFGDFVVAERLAVGGMAEIFLAARPGKDGKTELGAVKRLLPHLTWEPEFVRMFLDEVRIASGLAHSNIAAVHEFGTGEGGHYLAMEYVHGKNLRDLLRRFSTSTPPLWLGVGIALELAGALAYAHDYASPDLTVVGLIHRDVSPSNVMVSFDGRVKLLDFGIARATGRTQVTKAGTFKGKIGYMAPEQCRGGTVDARTDLFALGVLLYELTTGRRAFYADNDFAVIGRILAGEYARPSEVAADYPPALEAIVERALAVDPEKRFASAADFATALGVFAAGLDLGIEARAAYMRECFGHVPPPVVDLRKLERNSKAAGSRARTVLLVAGVSAAVGLAAFFAGSSSVVKPTGASSDARVADPGSPAPEAGAASPKSVADAPAATQAEDRPKDVPGLADARAAAPDPRSPAPAAIDGEVADPAPSVPEGGAVPSAARTPTKRSDAKRRRGRRGKAAKGEDERVSIDPDSLLAPSLRGQ